MFPLGRRHTDRRSTNQVHTHSIYERTIYARHRLQKKKSTPEGNARVLDDGDSHRRPVAIGR